jgi:hypothetical protein
MSVIEHCRKITASDVARLGVRNKALVPDSGITSGLNSSNGVSVHFSSSHLAGAVNLSSEVDQNARLTKLIEGPETEAFDC